MTFTFMTFSISRSDSASKDFPITIPGRGEGQLVTTHVHNSFDSRPNSLQLVNESL